MRAAHTGLSTKHLWERKGDLRKAWRLLYVVMRALRKLSRISRWMLYRVMGEHLCRTQICGVARAVLNVTRHEGCEGVSYNKSIECWEQKEAFWRHCSSLKSSGGYNVQP